MKLGDALALADQRPSGFDYMRLTLALAVLFSHSVLYCYGTAVGDAFWQGPARPFLRLILPMFFALSGFLVAGSLARCRTLVSFLGLRVIRIYPALTVEVFLSAGLIGIFLTTMPIGQYLSDPLFYKYLVNVTGHISYFLPGVFENNPYPRSVNSQLWTVPYELKCYIAISLLYLVGVVRRNYVVFIGIILVVALDIYKKGGNFGSPVAVSGEMLVAYFLAGVAMYLYKDKLPFGKGVFAGSFVLSAVFLSVVDGGEYISLFPVAYMTSYLGLLNPKRTLYSGWADYSYGIFLYGAAIQQSVVYLFPGLREWYWNVIISLPICFLVGVMSWIFVEKPAMKLRGLIKNIEGVWMSFVDRFKPREKATA